jgi:hypothetical protein
MVNLTQSGWVSRPVLRQTAGSLKTRERLSNFETVYAHR